MGIRSKLRETIKNAVDKLSGDYSAAAPDEIQPYARPGRPQDDVEVVMAKLRRPPPPKKGKSSKG